MKLCNITIENLITFWLSCGMIWFIFWCLDRGLLARRGVKTYAEDMFVAVVIAITLGPIATIRSVYRLTNRTKDY